MSKALIAVLTALTIAGGLSASAQVLVVPTDIQQPGTQPGQVGNLESPNKCDNCHGGYNTAVEPAYNWRGSMMSQATRDPIFWATMGIAEQDFAGAGDLCIRCHSVEGWVGGRSTPTDGSGLAAGDATGVSCDACHKMTNTDNSEWLGVMVAPFIANDGGNPAIGYYGTGMYSLWNGAEKLGPYADAVPKHQFHPSLFHRSVNFCGTCHDVSNPAVGDLAHNNGAQVPLAPGSFSGVPGSPVDGKAAFNNFPFQYGVVERTFSESKASLLSQTRVADYATLPAELQAGAIQAAYQSAIVAGTGGNYADGATRYFSCQTCHVHPVTGVGCNKAGTPTRTDLPLHDMTGGNYWMPDAIQYLDAQGKLRLGGGLTATEIAALNAGKVRATTQLGEAVRMTVNGNMLRIVNLTGHKVISGYPEGRRMWLNVKWYNGSGALLREDGRYGPLTVNIGGTPTTVNTIVDLDDPHTKIYEAHYALTQEWAGQLLALGYSSSLPLSYDRESGAATYTLGQLAAQSAGTYHETFHFVLNNYVAKDNRIPPYGFQYDAARLHSSLPVPADQYGNPDPGGTYNYWDEVALSPPTGAAQATISLLYQPTSWEYIQFLYLANTGQVTFLANEGAYLLEAWLNTGMAAPYTMASTTWAPSGYTLTTSVVGSGSIVLNPPGGSYASGTSVQVTANASAGWHFDHWEGDLSGSTNPATIVMNGNKSVTAVFVQDTYALTTSVVGSGSIALNPPGGSYLSGTTVQVAANASPGWQFDHWEGDLSGSANPTTIVMDGNKSVTAVFVQDTYTLTTSVVGSGSIALDPPGGSYLSGTTVQLTANASPGWHFDHWQGDLSGSANPTTIVMDGNKSVTAVFVQDTYTLTTSVVGSGSIALDPPGGSYLSGTTVQLTANASPGWHFDHWEGDLSGSTNPTTIVMDGSKSVTAVFYATGDMNCDGVVNNQDIDGFVLALFDPAGYVAHYPNCNILNGDFTGDGFVNNQDIDGFVAALFGG